jgi:hypothetical protein
MKSLKLPKPAEIKKSLAALIACIFLGVGAHLLPHAVSDWIQVLQPILVAYGVWQAPANESPVEPAAPAPAAPPAPPAA